MNQPRARRTNAESCEKRRWSPGRVLLLGLAGCWAGLFLLAAPHHLFGLAQAPGAAPGQNGAGPTPLIPGSLAAEMAGDPEAIAAGKKVFIQNCGNEMCHGPRGGGNLMGTADGRKLTDDIWFRSDGTYQAIVATITAGVGGTAMQSWHQKLGDLRIRQVAAYVKSLSVGK